MADAEVHPGTDARGRGRRAQRQLRRDPQGRARRRAGRRRRELSGGAFRVNLAAVDHGRAEAATAALRVLARHAGFTLSELDATDVGLSEVMAELAEAGKVYIVNAGWNNDFLDEICRFTGKGDKHDDQVDAVSLAVGMLAKRRSKLLTF